MNETFSIMNAHIRDLCQIFNEFEDHKEHVISTSSLHIGNRDASAIDIPDMIVYLK